MLAGKHGREIGDQSSNQVRPRSKFSFYLFFVTVYIAFEFHFPDLKAGLIIAYLALRFLDNSCKQAIRIVSIPSVLIKEESDAV